MGGKRRANRLSGAVMARRQTRSADWGFPRWRGYGTERETVKVRLCDRHGCTLPGDCPAPKAPNSPERWWFCPDHAGEYNRHWDYFAGLSAEEAAARAADGLEQTQLLVEVQRPRGTPGALAELSDPHVCLLVHTTLTCT